MLNMLKKNKFDIILGILLVAFMTYINAMNSKSVSDFILYFLIFVTWALIVLAIKALITTIFKGIKYLYNQVTTKYVLKKN